MTRPAIRGRNQIEGTPLQVGPSGRGGFGLGYRHIRTRWVSAEADVMRFDARGSLRQSGQRVASLGTLKMTALSFTTQFHACMSCRADAWLGIGVSYVLIGGFSSQDLDAIGIGKVRVDNDFASLASAGVELPLGRRLAFALSARYLPLSADGHIEGDPEPSDIEVNPIVYLAGLRVRF